MALRPFQFAIAAAAIAGVAGCAGGTSTTSPALPGLSSPALAHEPLQPQHNGKRETASCPCLYVANFGSSTVTAFASGASGNVAPIATIGGAMTHLDAPTAVTLDAAGNLYVANRFSSGSDPGAVTVYPAGSNGNVAPTQYIRGGQTGVNYPVGIAVDPVTGNIFVANRNGNTITIYAPGTTGNVVPLATIAGSSTGLDVCGGLALDASQNIYVGNCNAVNIYAAGTTGNTAPMSTIAGRKTKIEDTLSLALDSAANVYVGNEGPGGANYQGAITVYSAGSHGNVAPTQNIRSGKTKIHFPYGLAIGGTGTIYTANESTNMITAYAAGATGNIAPTFKISGGRTALSEPWGVAIH